MNKTIASALLTLVLASSLQAQTEFLPQTLLKPKTSGSFTLPVNLEARTAYDTLGDRAGINMVFSPAFKPETAVPLRVEGADFFEALDRLSQQTGNFWFAWDSKTVIVAPDTQQYRRVLDPLTYKVFYLDNSVTNEIADSAQTALRSRLQLRGIHLALQARAIVVHGTASEVTAAERIIAEVTSQSLPLPASAPVCFLDNATTFLSVAENGLVRRVVPPTQAPLQNLSPGSVSIDMKRSARAIYEELASRASLNVVFDHSIRDDPAARFHVEGVDLINALDLLAGQTSTVWQPLNESTIFVMQNTQQNMRDQLQMAIKVVYLPGAVTRARLNETLNILRVSLSLRSLFQDEKHGAIVMRDTPLRVFLAEKVIADLNRNHGKPKSVTITPETSSLYAENGWVIGNANRARPQLEVKMRNKTSVRLRETPRAAFQTLAGRAGLEVVFDSRFADGPEMNVNLNNVDILDALDLLSWQTRNFWQVVDPHTIRVLPDSQIVRRDLEPMVERTIIPADSSDPNGLLNILRTVFAMRGVFLNDKNQFVIRDTPDNVVLAEKVIEVLGVAAAIQ